VQVKDAWKATDQLSSPLGRLLLDLPRGWTDSRREAAIVTALLMFAPVVEAMQAQAGVESGRFSLDVRLFNDVYKACPATLRPRLLSSPPAKFLPPQDFERMFLQTYRQRGLSADDRARMAGTLEAFLSRHPRGAARYEREIIELLRSNVLVLALRGLSMTGAFLAHLGREDLSRIGKKLDSRNATLRYSALRALQRLLERREQVDPDVTAFCLSESVRRRVQRLAARDSDPDNRVQAVKLLKDSGGRSERSAGRRTGRSR